MTIPTPRRILVGLEDNATAGVVATAAAHIAMDQDATALILLHVIDTHMVAGGLLGLSGVTVPVIETGDDQEAMLALAEEAIQAEYGALERPVPSITRKVSAGAPAAILAQAAEDVGAAAIVVGARRPHAFGRLVHPDVRASLAKCTKVPVHVVPLQADTPG
jgi:nucleotide-binding universal stress UspA family protein